MELQSVNVKIYCDGELNVELVSFIDLFHQWVRESTMDELLVDVADYRHVPAGPGVLLVALEADYGMDNANDRWGLRYNRKAPVEGSNEDRFRQALGAAVKACQVIETHFADKGPLRFSRTEFELFINDRALAPNTRETFAACRPELEAFIKSAFGQDDFELRHNDDPRSLFGVNIRLAKPYDPSSLLDLLKTPT